MGSGVSHLRLQMAGASRWGSRSLGEGGLGLEVGGHGFTHFELPTLFFIIVIFVFITFRKRVKLDPFCLDLLKNLHKNILFQVSFSDMTKSFLSLWTYMCTVIIPDFFYATCQVLVKEYNLYL